MGVVAIASAARTALNGLGEVVAQVEEVAEEVASAPAAQQDGSFVRSLDSLARLPALHIQALANARVFSTAEELFAVLGSLPRK